MSEDFKKVKESINSALEEIKKKDPKLYEHLKKSIIMDEKSDTFTFKPD